MVGYRCRCFLFWSLCLHQFLFLNLCQGKKNVYFKSAIYHQQESGGTAFLPEITSQATVGAWGNNNIPFLFDGGSENPHKSKYSNVLINP